MATPGRLPLNLFGISFGLSGLSGTWTTAHAAGLTPAVIGDLLWIAAFVAWVVTIARFAGQPGGWRALVSARVVSFWPTAGRVGVGVFLAVAAVFAGWFVGHLTRGGIDVDHLHPGYLLPTVAAGLIGGQSAATAGWHTAALGSYAVGLLFWALTGAVLLGRLALRPSLPGGLLPTMAIFAAPPAVGGNAWLAVNGGRLDTVDGLLLGTMIVLLLAQAFLIPAYARLPFTLGHWALTFTTAASGTYGIHWLTGTQVIGWRVWSWLILLVVTGIIGAIAVASVRFVLPGTRTVRVATGG